MLALTLLLAVGSSDTATIIPSEPRFASLQGGETLGAGNTELTLGAGFSTFSATYAQGASEGTDYGAVLELDWLTSELFAGGLYRSLQLRQGSILGALRARAGLYSNFGATWAVSTNQAAVGVQLAPGLAASVRASRGILSAGLDVPVTYTFARGGGWAIGVKGQAAFETPLWGDLLAGVRVGGGALWSYSGAPFAADSPRGILDLTALLTYKLL
jgi:hypothetical protein